jgi:serine phosphatase RsbU (regulator of sigma subunit)
VLHGRVTVDDDGAQILLASAGHPPPLVLRAGGVVEAVPAGGTLLGVIRDVVHSDVSVRLYPGDALLCFTDGVTEGRRAGVMFGDDGLAEALGSCAGLDADAIAERVTQTALDYQGGRTQDDLALLVLRVPRS